MKIYTRLPIAAAALATTLSGLQAKADTAIAFTPAEMNRCESIRKRQLSDERNRVYDKAFDSYVEICAASTWQMRGASDGGNYGHAFGIVKGACIVKDASGKPIVPPQLKPCPGGLVGVSSDYILFNVQWLASEGRDFFLYGDHNPGEPFDEAAASRIKSAAVARGVFQGVEFDDIYQQEIARDAAKNNMTPEQYKPLWSGKASLGTDFALASARGGVDCTRIPMRGTKPGFEDKPLKDLIAHLNKQNLRVYNEEQYKTITLPDGKTKKKGFDYDGAVNNCTSNFSNALASVGFWPMRDTSGHPSSNTDLIVRYGDISIPYNDMFGAYKRGSELDLEGTINKFRADKAAFDYFKTTGWMGAQAGVLLESIPALTYMNSVYNTSNNTNFGSYVYEAQKKLLMSLHDMPFLATFLQTKAGSFLRGLTADWMGVDLANLKPIPPRDKSEFDAVRDDDNHRATNLIVNLRWWNDLYARYLNDLNNGIFGDDEVVRELKDYFHKKFEQTSLLLGHQERLKPAPTPACPES